jgi:chemotaxis signal transduction protein
MSLVVFLVKDMQYAIPTENINEIVNVVYPQHLIQNSFVDCLINYHGELLPTIETCKLFDSFHGDYTPDSMLVITNIDGFKFSLLTDNIDSIIEKKDIKITDINSTYISKNIILKEKIIPVLDIKKIVEKILSDKNWSAL